MVNRDMLLIISRRLISHDDHNRNSKTNTEYCKNQIGYAKLLRKARIEPRTGSSVSVGKQGTAIKPGRYVVNHPPDQPTSPPTEPNATHYLPPAILYPPQPITQLSDPHTSPHLT
jgi:hypothetical protein